MIYLPSFLAGIGSFTLPLADFGPVGIGPFLIPLAGMGLGLVGIIFGSIDKMQKRRFRHELMRIALEKGQPLPPELLEERPVRRRGVDRLAGLINLGVGAALMIALYALPNHAYGCYWFGLVPGFIGLALLLNWAMERSESDKS